MDVRTGNNLPQQVQEFQAPEVGKVETNGKSLTPKWATSTAVETRLGLCYLFNGFRFLGVHMPKRQKFLYICWSIVINVAVTLWLPTAFVLGVLQALKGELVIGNLLTSLQVALNVVGCSIKIILMAFLLPKLKNCEPIMAMLDKRCVSKEEQECVRRFNRNGKRMVVLFACAYWTYSTSTCISAVIFGRLPYNTYNPIVDARESAMNFLVAVVMEMIPMYIACFQQVVDDSYAVIYVSILRTHLQALILRIQGMNVADGGKRLSQNIEELKMCIIDHKNIIELYNDVAPVISITIFVQFTITATLLGTTLINILIFATDIASIVASCFYVLAVVVEVFPLCYYAQCLMDENNRLAEVIFHSNWVDQDVRYRKMLIFFMQRSQKPIEFTAGKLFPITLSSFLSIAKFSFSLYTLIKEMDIKKRYGIK